MNTPAFTHLAAALVAENDRRARAVRRIRGLAGNVPEQRRSSDNQPIEPAGTVIEVEGSDGQRMRFVSNGHVWIACVGGGDTYRAVTPEEMNRRYEWRIVVAIMTVSVSGDRGKVEE